MARTPSWSAEGSKLELRVPTAERQGGRAEEVQQIAAGPGKGWISFAFKDPISGKVLPKENYVEKAGDYTYLAGVYTR